MNTKKIKNKLCENVIIGYDIFSAEYIIPYCLGDSFYYFIAFNQYTILNMLYDYKKQIILSAITGYFVADKNIENEYFNKNTIIMTFNIFEKLFYNSFPFDYNEFKKRKKDFEYYLLVHKKIKYPTLLNTKSNNLYHYMDIPETSVNKIRLEDFDFVNYEDFYNKLKVNYV